MSDTPLDIDKLTAEEAREALKVQMQGDAPTPCHYGDCPHEGNPLWGCGKCVVSGAIELARESIAERKHRGGPECLTADTTGELARGA